MGFLAGKPRGRLAGKTTIPTGGISWALGLKRPNLWDQVHTSNEVNES